MNTKQTIEFNLRKLIVLMFLADNPRDLEEETGSLIPITKIKNILNISYSALSRCLHSLEEDGLIENVNGGYIIGKRSKKWKILEKAELVISCSYNIKLYIDICNKYYNNMNNINLINNKTNNISIYNIPNVSTFNSDESDDYTASDFNEKLYKIVGIVTMLMNTNNLYSKIQNRHNYRLETVKNKKMFKGRVTNPLCNTKSGKKEYISQDKRFYREDVLKAYGYNGYYEIFDIKNQIPRLTYIIQGGGYDDIEDFYKVDGIDRNTVKEFAMSAYFDKSIEAGAWHKCRAWLNKEKINYSKKAHELFRKIFTRIWNYYHSLFTPIGAEIFLWTSLWEQLIIKEAREQLSANLLNVYDAFYYNDGSIKNELNRIARETSIIVRELYQSE